MNRADVIEFLEAEEPDYAAGAAMFGAGSAEILAEIVATEGPRLASKAAYLAGILDPDAGRVVLATAAAHPDPVVRVAAAGALEHQLSLVPELAPSLLADPDAGVRKWALRSTAHATPITDELRSHIILVEKTDPEPVLRELAREINAR